MLKQQKIFFDFLRFCIGSAREIPCSLKEVDWKELYAIAQKQALLGEQYGRMYMEKYRYTGERHPLPIFLNYFSVMELSSLFLYKSIQIDKMEVIKTDIEGVLIIEPRLFRDARGYFFESFSEREFKEKVEPSVGYKVEFCQDNESMSSYGVMRGLHFQRPPFTQSKLVRCVKGRVLDVAVDIRKGSPTYGKHVAVELTEDNHRQFFIPKGFAHGFAVLSETAVFQYKCDNFYHPEADGGISILDESLGIDWRIPTEHANLSEKDMKHEALKDFESPFDF